jgi:uncharacterized membrane protein
LPRHAKALDQQLGVIRWSTVAFVWLCGLAAGFCAVLAAAAKYGCMSGDRAVGCKTSGSVLGIVLLITVIVIVTVVTLTTANRPRQRVLVIGGIGVAGLAICTIAAVSLLATT